MESVSQLLDDMRLGNRKAKTQACQSVRLAQGSRDDDLFTLPDQIDAVGVRKISVGFVHNERTGQAIGKVLDTTRGQQRA